MDFEAIDQALKKHFETVTPEEFRNNLQKACPHLFDSDSSNEDTHITSEPNSNLKKDNVFEKWEEIASEPSLGGSLPKNQHEKVTQELLLEQEPAMLNPLEILVAENDPITANKVLPRPIATQKNSWKALLLLGGLLIGGASAFYFSDKEFSPCFGSCSVIFNGNDRRGNASKGAGL